MKIFVLMEDFDKYDYSPSEVFGVFSSEEKAEEEYKRIGSNIGYCNLDIKEFILDEKYLEKTIEE